MVGGILCMVGLDVSAKWLLQDYGMAQLVLLRCGFSAGFIGCYVIALGRTALLKTSLPGWHLLRSCLMAGSMYAFFYALGRIPLAQVLTFAFAAPLVVTALSQPVLREPVGPWRWAAVLAGFGGVVVLLDPGGGLGEPAALVALAGAILYAVISLTSRKLRMTESTEALSLYLFVVPTTIAIVWLALGPADAWRSPDAFAWALFAVCGLCGGVAFVLMNAAFRVAPAAILVPFEYTGLIWAAAAGFLIWGEVPTARTWVGAAIIAASGLFILYRETRAARPQVSLG